MPTIATQVQGALKDVTNLRFLIATAIAVGGFLFYLQSNLPGAAGLRRLIGVPGAG